MATLPSSATGDGGASQRVAIIDLGSNTFRLQVFEYSAGLQPRLVDEIRDPVRLSSGLVGGRITDDAISRARRAARTYALFCRTVGITRIEAVATSAIREAANQAEVMEAISGPDGLDVTILSTEEEADRGYLGVVNSTDLTDGGVLDIGGGSMQLSRVEGRHLTDFVSHPLGAVRATERFLTDDPPKKRQIKALKEEVAGRIEAVDWAADAGRRLFGIGGSIRTLAAVAQRWLDYPLREVHGFRLSRAIIDELIGEMSERSARDRARIRGLKRDRADIMLAAGLVAAQVMDSIGAKDIEVCAGGLREGVFYRSVHENGPLIDDVREATVLGLASGYSADLPHARQVARIAEKVYRQLAELGLQADERVEREWLWAAAMLHDTGVLIDYHDHHKHSQYLVLNAGLPGFDHRELAIISTLVRGHRKSLPSLAVFGAITAKADQERLDRLSACLRLAEQLERGRARTVVDVSAATEGSTLAIEVVSGSDESLAIWAASQEAPSIKRAFDLELEIRQSEVVAQR